MRHYLAEVMEASLRVTFYPLIELNVSDKFESLDV